MSSGSDAVPMDLVLLSTTGRTEHAEHMGPVNLRRESVVGTTVAHQVYMNESPRYLITGVVLGALGFLVAVIPFFIRIFEHLVRNESIPLEEVPPTVSEMVSKWETAEARIFFGFELSASLVIMLSWYPYKLQNVCCLPFYGGCHANLLCCRPSYATFRQFGPTLGLLLVSCCPTVPMEHTELVDYVLVAVHGFAAILMFCSFLTCEAHSLSLWPFKCVAPDEYKPNVEARERHFRIWTWRVAFFGFCGFLILQGVLFFIEKHEAPCAISFWLEVTAGLSMLSNHSVIWYYCKERERRDLRAPPS